MKFEGLFYGICWFGIVREILFGNGRYGKVREIFRTGMDGTGSPGIPVPYRMGNFPYRGNTKLSTMIAICNAIFGNAFIVTLLTINHFYRLENTLSHASDTFLKKLYFLL